MTTISRARTNVIRAVVALAIITGPVSVALPAGAAGQAVVVSGVLSPPNGTECPLEAGDLGALVATGSLEGCWYLVTQVVDHANDNGGGFRAHGTERFAGCLGERCGNFFTTFTFTAKFAADGTEIHGRCHHPVVAGDGGFAGITGNIEMHDEPNGCVLYNGELRL
jgi:hypothetical protein